MLNYNHTVLAQGEYEANMRRLERRLAGRYAGEQSGFISRIRNGVGQSLKRLGTLLKQQNTAQPMQPQYKSGRSI